MRAAELLDRSFDACRPVAVKLYRAQRCISNLWSPSLGDDYPQDPSNIVRELRAYCEISGPTMSADRTTRHIGVSVGSAWTWLSGGTSVTSVRIYL